MLPRIFAFFAVLAAADTTRAGVTQFRLQNGPLVLVNSMDGACDVAMETVYDVGFIHEPENLPQASHLLEHLICYSPAAGFGDRDAMQFLNRMGSANAETLPALTHYDYVVPKQEFPTAVRIEADRLRRFSVDRVVLEREAKRCYQEVAFVEANPQAGLLKHAFMACSHAWRFQSSRVMLRSGMESYRSEDLQDFHARFYNPKHLIISISGAISADDARKILNAELGAIKSRDADFKMVDWSKVPVRHAIRWDAGVRGLCIAWPPPKSAEERTSLSVLGLHAMRSLVSDSELPAKCHHVSCSNTTWPVGELPLFVYAALKETADTADVERLLTRRFEIALKGAATEAALMVPALRMQAQRSTTWAEMQEASGSLVRLGRKPEEAIRLCLLQDALNRVIFHEVLGRETDVQPNPSPMDARGFEKLIHRTVSTDPGRVVNILPLNEQKAGRDK